MRKQRKHGRSGLYLPLSGRSDGSHVKQLTCVILNSTQHNDGDGVALRLDGPQDVLCPQSLLPLIKFINVSPHDATCDCKVRALALPGVAAAVACCPAGPTHAVGSETPRRTADVKPTAGVDRRAGSGGGSKFSRQALNTFRRVYSRGPTGRLCPPGESYGVPLLVCRRRAAE